MRVWRGQPSLHDVAWQGWSTTAGWLQIKGSTWVQAMILKEQIWGEEGMP